MKHETVTAILFGLLFLVLIVISYAIGFENGKIEENKEIVSWYSNAGIGDTRFSNARDIISYYENQRGIDAPLIYFYGSKLVECNNQNLGIIAAHVNQSNGKTRYYNSFNQEIDINIP